MAEPYVGEIRMFAGNFAPDQWALCDGRVMSIAENEILFSLLGTTYGGDGQGTFGLPDLRGRAPMHQSSSYPLGQKGGVESVTLNQLQLGAHTHAAVAGTGGTAANSPNGAYWGTSSVNSYSAAAPNTPLNAISPSGGGQAHDNMMPFLPVNFIIALNGLYPSFD